MMAKPADTPADVFAEEGEVLVEGPDGISYSFTPDAAMETSDRLLSGGMEARGQRLKKEIAERHDDPSRK